MKDKRYYRRLKVQNIPILLYTSGDEITAEIHDISEYGIGIIVNSNIKLDNIIRFTICDTVTIGNTHNIYLVNSYCHLKHQEQNNNIIYFGGYVTDSYYHNYYLEKELESVFHKGE